MAFNLNDPSVDWSALASQVAGGLGSDAGRKAMFDNATKLGLSAEEASQVVNKVSPGAAYNAQDIAGWGGKTQVTQDQLGTTAFAPDDTNTPDWDELDRQIRGSWGTPEGRANIFSRGKALGFDEQSMADAVSKATGTYVGNYDIAGWGNKDVAGKPPTFTGAVEGAPAFNLSGFSGPSMWGVAPNQTVASQLETLLAKDSPLMQRARTRALQTANARGLANSSMAAEAGEAAAIDSMLPVAQADAGTFARAGEFNAGARNTFARDDNQFSREQAMANFNVSANDWASGRAFDRGETAADNNLGREIRLLEARVKYDGSEADNKLVRDLEFLKAQQSYTTGNTTQTQADTLQRGYINSINQARTDYAEKLAAISTSSDMESGLKTETLGNLKTTYNTMIENYAKLLGWDPASWLIAAEPTTPEPAAAAPSGGPSSPRVDTA